MVWETYNMRDTLSEAETLSWHRGTWTCPYTKRTFIPAVDVSLFDGCYLSLVKVTFSFVLPFELVVTPRSLVSSTGWMNIFSVLFPGSLATTLDHPWPTPTLYPPEPDLTR